MKMILRALITTLLTLALVGLPLLPERAFGPMSVDETSIPLAFAADEDGDAWVAAPIEDDATIVGLTWDDPDDAPDDAEVRVKVDGAWQDWESVPIDDDHAPDPGSDESDHARGGTAPVVVEGADAVQWRASGDEAPERVVAEVISVEDPTARRRVEGRASQADAAPSRPSIRGRDAWNGDSCVDRRSKDIDYTTRVKVMFVHHTAGHTSYSQSQVPSIIRGICSYHVNSRGWDDIGYNTLVDRYGTIWQGRQGDLQRGVQGAHTGGFNAWSHGVVLIGDHTKQGVTSAARSAIVDYGAWYLDLHNVDPRRRTTITSTGSSRWSSGTKVTFDAVSGHRAASYTACPGDYCLGHLGQFMLSIDATGGFKTYGGWSDKRRYEYTSTGWQRPRVKVWFDETADWTVMIKNVDGKTVWSRNGRGRSADVTWNATTGGSPAPRGSYRVHVDARSVASGRAASPADHRFSLALLPGTFDDVSDHHLFFSDIRWLALQGITQGCNPPANTRYCPGAAVTRGQMAAFLARAADLPTAPHAGFEDVPRSHRFADDVAALAAAGITRGCGDGRFCPDARVTREQMAAFIVRAAGLTRISHPGFKDVRSGNQYRGDIRRLATADVTLGCNPPTNSRFCPGERVTRGQMAAFIKRSDL